MTTDLPSDNNGDILFGIEDKMEQLSNFMTLNDLEIDEKDLRKKIRNSELNALIDNQIVDVNENDINLPDTLQVENFINKIEPDMGTTDPEFIFPEDEKNMNYVNVIKQSNQSFQKERDRFLIPPPPDLQQITSGLSEQQIITLRNILNSNP